MKKFMGLSTLLLGGALFLTGCSCGGDTGVYKFDSFELTMGGETKTYTCSVEEKEDFFVAEICEGMEKGTWELKDDGVYVIGAEGEEETEEGQYKVEDGKLFVRYDSEAEWMETGTIDNGKIIMEYPDMGMGIGIKVTLKK